MNTASINKQCSVTIVQQSSLCMKQVCSLGFLDYLFSDQDGLFLWRFIFFIFNFYRRPRFLITLDIQLQRGSFQECMLLNYLIIFLQFFFPVTIVDISLPKR